MNQVGFGPVNYQKRSQAPRGKGDKSLLLPGCTYCSSDSCFSMQVLPLPCRCHRMHPGITRLRAPPRNGKCFFLRHLKTSEITSQAPALQNINTNRAPSAPAPSSMPRTYEVDGEAAVAFRIGRASRNKAKPRSESSSAGVMQPGKPPGRATRSIVNH